MKGNYSHQGTKNYKEKKFPNNKTLGVPLCLSVLVVELRIVE